jgi:hypothetical protein
MDKKIHEEIDPREQAHREAQKKHKNTPVIIFNNVLSSIINDPKAPQTQPEKNPETIPDAGLPNISFDSFNQYLTSIKDPYRRFVQHRIESENEALKKREEEKKEKQADMKVSQTIQTLNEIPEIFLSERFDLHDPATFEAILSTSNSSFSELHEKLLSYKDNVESALVKHVTRRSTEVFTTLADVRRLHAEVGLVTDAAGGLNARLQTWPGNWALQALGLLQMKARREKLRLVIEKYQLMSMVIHARPMLETLLTSGDFTTALDLAVTTRDLIQTELRGIEAMNESLTHLQKMVKSIARKMTDEFVHVSLTAPYHRTAGQTGLPDKLEQNQLTVVHYFLELLAMRKAPKALSKYREAALKYVKELIRTTMVEVTVTTKQFNEHVKQMDIEKFTVKLDELYQKLIDLVRRLVDNHAIIALALSDVLHGQYEKPQKESSLPGDLVENVDQLLHRCRDQVTDINDVAPEPAGSRQQQLEELKVKQRHIYKRFRHQQHREFKRKTRESKSATPAPGTPTFKRNPAKKQVATTSDPSTPPTTRRRRRDGTMEPVIITDEEQRYLSEQYHTTRMTSLIENDEVLTAILDTVEKLLQDMLLLRADSLRRVGVDFIANVFVKCDKVVTTLDGMLATCQPAEPSRPKPRTKMIRATVLSIGKGFLEMFHTNKVSQMSLILDNEQWTQAEVAAEFKDIVLGLLHPSLLQHTDGNNPASPRGAKDNQQELVIDGEKFVVLNSELMFFKLISDYLTCFRKIPLIRPDVIIRVVEMFKLFNLKTHSLVLHQGAMQAASNLKSITAKNLAVTSQCLSLQIKLIPHIRENLKDGLVEKQMPLLNEMNTVLQDYKDHRQQIFDKFVALMRERADQFFKNFKVDVNAPKPSNNFAELVKKTLVLHKVLYPILPLDQFQSVFKGVVHAYYERIKKAAESQTLDANQKRRLAGDIQYLLDYIKGLEGIADPGEELVAFIKTLQ